MNPVEELRKQTTDKFRYDYSYIISFILIPYFEPLIRKILDKNDSSLLNEIYEIISEEREIFQLAISQVLLAEKIKINFSIEGLVIEFVKISQGFQLKITLDDNTYKKRFFELFHAEMENSQDESYFEIDSKDLNSPVWLYYRLLKSSKITFSENSLEVLLPEKQEFYRNNIVNTANTKEAN